jgi:hypothetical protein
MRKRIPLGDRPISFCDGFDNRPHVRVQAITNARKPRVGIDVCEPGEAMPEDESGALLFARYWLSPAYAKALATTLLEAAATSYSRIWWMRREAAYPW